MIYAIMDDGELVGLVSDLHRSVIHAAIRRVDEAFRKLLDITPANQLPYHMCAELGIAPRQPMEHWTDVLLAYLVSLGGRLVEHEQIQAIP